MNAEATLLGDIPRWALMWLLASGLFFAGKVAMLLGSGLRGWRLAGFALAWVGMDTAPFHDKAKEKRQPALFALRAATWPLFNTLLGVGLLWGVARHVAQPLAAGWVGMVGLILMLHFGTFALLAVAWNALGVPVTPIMRLPIAATSLTEFWGRRWNLAFRDVSHRAVFQPVSKRFGLKVALWTAFLVSGLAHELVISVPAGAGFGLPTGYFLLQALGMVLERKAASKSWFRTHAFTLLPAFILFHPLFVERVMNPFFHTLGALP